MSITTFAPPPIGIERETYDYLFKLTRQLNLALTAAAVRAPETNTKSETGDKPEEKKALQGLSELKTLIIKTANDAQREMTALETKLTSSYVASSDFGTFQEEIQTQLVQTAESLNQVITYYAALSDQLSGVSNTFDSYVIETKGYIRQGIIGYEEGVPIIGIAIGQDIRVTGETETVDGHEYDVIDTTSNMSIWTPDKLAFYVNGEEIAHFSNSALNVGDVVISGKLFLSKNKWEISHTNGFTIKWLGG